MNDTFLHNIKKYIEVNGLPTPVNGVAGVALSGGADSVALLLAMVELGYDCVALHCNFGLRGDESDEDTRFCQELCERLEVPLLSVKWNTCQEKTPGESIEMCCRRLRYEWFERMAVENGLHAIAVAHHREDCEETILLNLFRGTGPEGLKGIAPRRGIYFRPLLQTTRREIEEYCVEKSIDWRVDSSNFSNRFLRNALRNEVLPTVAEHFPDFAKGMALTAANMTYAAGIVERHVAEVCGLCVADNVVDVANLIRLDGVDLASRTLWHILRKKMSLSATLSQCDNIIKSVNESGRVFKFDSVTYELNRGKLCPLDVVDSDEFEIVFGEDIFVPIRLAFKKISLTGGEMGASEACGVEECKSIQKRVSPLSGGFKNVLSPLSVAANQLLVDSEILKGNPRFLLRRPRTGDRIKPFGMRGSRLLSDIFRDMKMSASEKASQWVLTCNDEIIWIVGLRASRHFPITASTTNAYILTLDE